MAYEAVIDYSAMDISPEEQRPIDMSVLSTGYMGRYIPSQGYDAQKDSRISIQAQSELAMARANGSVVNWAAEEYRNSEGRTELLDADGGLYGKASVLFAVKVLAKAPAIAREFMDEEPGEELALNEGIDSMISDVESLRQQCQASGQSVARVGNSCLDGITDKAVDVQIEAHRQKQMAASKNRKQQSAEKQNDVGDFENLTPAQQAQQRLASMFGSDSKIQNVSSQKTSGESRQQPETSSVDWKSSDKKVGAVYSPARSDDNWSRSMGKSGVGQSVVDEQKLQYEQTQHMLSKGVSADFGDKSMKTVSPSEYMNKHLVQQFACTQQYELGGEVIQKWPGLEKVGPKDSYPYWYSKAEHEAFSLNENENAANYTGFLSESIIQKFPEFAMYVKDAPSYEIALQRCQPFTQRAMDMYRQHKGRMSYQQLADAVSDDFANEGVGQQQSSIGKAETITRKQDFYHSLAKRMADPKRNAGLNQLDMPMITGMDYYR